MHHNIPQDLLKDLEVSFVPDGLCSNQFIELPYLF